MQEGVPGRSDREVILFFVPPQCVSRSQGAYVVL